MVTGCCASDVDRGSCVDVWVCHGRAGEGRARGAGGYAPPTVTDCDHLVSDGDVDCCDSDCEIDALQDDDCDEKIDDRDSTCNSERSSELVILNQSVQSNLAHSHELQLFIMYRLWWCMLRYDNFWKSIMINWYTIMAPLLLLNLWYFGTRIL